MAWNSAYIDLRYWYTRTRISEPTPIKREHLTYHPVYKNYQFLGRDSKRMLQILLHEESQNYIFIFNVVTNITKYLQLPISVMK